MDLRKNLFMIHIGVECIISYNDGHDGMRQACRFRGMPFKTDLKIDHAVGHVEYKDDDFSIRIHESGA